MKNHSLEGLERMSPGDRQQESDLHALPLKVPRILEFSFEIALQEGVLRPLLDLVRKDRDLIAEIRSNILHVYCKGQRLIEIAPLKKGFKFSSHRKFWPEISAVFNTANEVDAFCEAKIPLLKQKIACVRSKAMEIEFEQMLIRATNFENLNSDYIVIDRQNAAAGGRTDLLGAYWPGRRSNTLPLALIEVKYGLKGGIRGLPQQVAEYLEHLSQNVETLAEGLEKQLHQKARLGLLEGLSREAQKKLQSVRISRQVADIRVVIALVDYNPRSTLLSLDELSKMSFAHQIDVFHLGFGMWRSNAVPLVGS